MSEQTRDFEKRADEESYQEDWDLAWDAAHALEGELSEPDSKLSQSTFTRYELGTKEARKQIVPTLKRLFDRLRGGPEKRQKNITIFLEATEREARRKRLDGLCSELGVLDRGGFETVARAEAAKIVNRRGGAAEGFAVMIADVGGLGRVNDALGHEAGDELIVGVAEAMHLTIRATDILGRTTGDEFMALIAAPDEVTARGIMETGFRNRDGETTQGVVAKTHQRVEALRDRLKSKYGDAFPQDDPNAAKGKFPGRTSIGWKFFSKEAYVTRYREYLQDKQTGGKTLFSQMLMREADREMYQRKHQGD